VLDNCELLKAGARRGVAAHLPVAIFGTNSALGESRRCGHQCHQDCANTGEPLRNVHHSVISPAESGTFQAFCCVSVRVLALSTEPSLSYFSLMSTACMRQWGVGGCNLPQRRAFTPQ